jgi:hypothetical protein
MTDKTTVRWIEDPLGRWIIVNDQNEAWSGSQWVPHRNKLPVNVQICNFPTREEAQTYLDEQQWSSY